MTREVFNRYEIMPKVCFAYDRITYFKKDNPDLRILFDFNIRSRRNAFARRKFYVAAARHLSYFFVNLSHGRTHKRQVTNPAQARANHTPSVAFQP